MPYSLGDMKLLTLLQHKLTVRDGVILHRLSHVDQTTHKQLVCPLISPANLTRILDKLADRGIVDRKPCPEDGRSQIVSLTEAGREMLRGN